MFLVVKMSSKSIEKKIIKIEYKEEDEYFDLKRVVTPFSLFFLKDERYIYDGSEKIPFNKRDPLYKTAFLHEFSNSLRKTKGKI